MTIREAIKILTDHIGQMWMYEGGTKIDGVRCYMMRKYHKDDPDSTQSVVYFTMHGLRQEAIKEKLRRESEKRLNRETHFS